MLGTSLKHAGMPICMQPNHYNTVVPVWVGYRLPWRDAWEYDRELYMKLAVTAIRTQAVARIFSAGV